MEFNGITKICEKLFPDRIHILYYYHLSENIHKYVYCLYLMDEVFGRRWVNQVLESVTEGRVEEAIDKVTEKKITDLSEGVVKLPEYMIKKQHKIDYKNFREQGFLLVVVQLKVAIKWLYKRGWFNQEYIRIFNVHSILLL